MEFDNSIILKLLEYGFIGLGVILTFMTYDVLKRSLKKDKPSHQVLTLTRIFLFFSTLLLVCDFTLRVVNTFQFQNPVTIEVNPTNPNIWNRPKDIERWYNAPYALASDEFIQENINEIKIHEVRSQHLLFEGNTDEELEDFKERFKRMRILMIEMSKEVHLNDYVEVRIARNRRIPEVSFFNPTKENGDDAIIYYIKSLILPNGRPEVAFLTDDVSLVKFFKRRFLEEFQDAELISITDLSNPDISDSFFYTD